MITKKKRFIIVITAIFIAVVMLMSVMLSALLPFTFGEKLASPQGITVVAVSSEPTYSVLLGWKAVEGAIAYTIEYKYQLYPEKTHTMSSIKSVCEVPRNKGTIQFRVKSRHERDLKDSVFSEWYSYKIKPLLFNKPSKLVIERQRDYETGKYGYKATEDSRNNWKPVKYTYKTVSKKVDCYEVVMVPPGETLATSISNSVVMPEAELLRNNWYLEEVGKWKMCIRAVNYAMYEGKIIYDTTNKPELFNLYEVGDEWTEIEFTVVK